MVDAASFWWVVGAYCLLQFCMNVGQAGYQGLMPDRVGSEQRGSASGWLGVATLSGQVAGVLKVLFAAAAIFILAGGAVLAQVRARVAPGSGVLVLAPAHD